MRLHRRQPARLLCPWDSLGKNTGVGCHFLLQCMKVKSESEVAQSWPTLRPHGMQPTRLLRPRYFPDKSTGVGAIAFSAKHSQCLSKQAVSSWNSPARILKWITMPSSWRSSQPRDQPGSPLSQADSFPSEPPGKPNSQVGRVKLSLFELNNHT